MPAAVIGLQLNRGLPVGVEEPPVTRFEVAAAPAAADRGQEVHDVSDVNDLKREARDARTNAKEAWRGLDGESVGDKVANTTDRVKDALGNAGDEIHEDADRAARDASYEQGRVDEMSRSS
jgi:hypothetical protein